MASGRRRVATTNAPWILVLDSFLGSYFFMVSMMMRCSRHGRGCTQ